MIRLISQELGRKVLSFGAFFRSANYYHPLLHAILYTGCKKGKQDIPCMMVIFFTQGTVREINASGVIELQSCTYCIVSYPSFLLT